MGWGHFPFFLEGHPTLPASWTAKTVVSPLSWVGSANVLLRGQMVEEFRHRRPRRDGDTVTIELSTTPSEYGDRS